MMQKVLVNVVRGTAAAAIAAAIGTAPVVWADEAASGNLIDLSKLVFYKGDAYSVSYGPGVSTQAIETSVVRKIGYGKTTVVNVTTTSSGTYSSDGMLSPHILYPGIQVERLPEAADDSEGGANQPPRLAYWVEGRGWVVQPFVTAGSFAVVSRTPYATVVRGSEGNCVVTATVARC